MHAACLFAISSFFVWPAHKKSTKFTIYVVAISDNWIRPIRHYVSHFKACFDSVFETFYPIIRCCMLPAIYFAGLLSFGFLTTQPICSLASWGHFSRAAEFFRCFFCLSSIQLIWHSASGSPFNCEVFYFAQPIAIKWVSAYNLQRWNALHDERASLSSIGELI